MPPLPRPMLGARPAVALLMVAALHIGRGLRVLMDSDPPYSPESAVLHDMLSRDWQAAAWLTVGAALVVLALTSTRRGWWLATLLPTITALSYGWSVLMWLLPDLPSGSPSALGQVIIWVAITGLIYVIAGWPETIVERQD